MKTRKDRLLPGGVPRYVRCYDQPEAADRYTVCFSGKAGSDDGWYSYRAMSKYPFDPQGIGLWLASEYQPCDTMGEVSGKWYWPPAIGRKCHLGKRIPFTELPEDCRKLVLQDYLEIWKL